MWNLFHVTQYVRCLFRFTQLLGLKHHYAVSEDSLILKDEVMDENNNPVFWIMNKTAAPSLT